MPFIEHKAPDGALIISGIALLLSFNEYKSKVEGKMKKLLVGSLLSLAVFAVFAQTAQEFISKDEWHFQGTTKNGDFYIKGVIKDKDTYDFWMKAENKKLECDASGNPFSANAIERLNCQQLNKTSTEKTLLHTILNCKTRRIKIADSVLYNYLGEMIFSDSKGGDWEAIVPDTIGEAISTKLCK